MDSKQSPRFTSPASHPAEMHNFMSMSPPPMLHYQQRIIPLGDGEENRCNLMQLQGPNLQQFWHRQIVEFVNISDFKSQQTLPLARIKRIMKSDENVKMVSAETPLIFAKACELFIEELTLRSWFHTETNNRRTMQRCDIGRAITRYPTFNFLGDIVPDVHEGEGISNLRDVQIYLANAAKNFPVDDPRSHMLGIPPPLMIHPSTPTETKKKDGEEE